MIHLVQELLQEPGYLPGIKMTFREGWLPDKPEMRYMRDHMASKGTGRGGPCTLVLILALPPVFPQKARSDRGLSD